MAKTLVCGDVAQVEILRDPADEDLMLATCFVHNTGPANPPCEWRDHYDTTDDAIAGAEQHADGVR